MRRLFKLLFENKNQAWTFYAQLTKLLSGFVFVAVLARSLPSSLLALWYVFASVLGLVGLLEMGLGQVIGRHVAYLNTDLSLGKVRGTDVASLAEIGEKVYWILFLLICLAALPVLLYKVNSYSTGLMFALLFYVVGSAFSVVSGYYSAFINGVGEMWKTQRASILSAVLNISVVLSMLFFPATLIIPCIALFLSQTVLIVLLRVAYKRLAIFGRELSDTNNDRLATMFSKKTKIKAIIKDSGFMAIGFLSYQILTNGYFLVVSSHVPTTTLASFGLSLQFVVVVTTFSMIWSQSKFFEMAGVSELDDSSKLRLLFYGCLIRVGLVSLFGLIAVFFIAPILLLLLNSQTKLLENHELMAFLSAYWFEFVISQFGVLLLARGKMHIASISLAASSIIYGGAYLMFSLGYPLIDVIIARVCLFTIAYGAPVLWVSRTLLYPSPRLPLVSEYSA
jgi:O-antigen/teichoic acid export membrane protein